MNRIGALGPTGIWLLLVGITVISTLAAERHLAGMVITVVIFILAAIKAHMVIMHYMEAKHAAPHWRALYQWWVAIAATILAIGHFVAG